METKVQNSLLWVDKYRPSTLEDYVLNPEIKEYFKGMVKNKTLQNMTLCGIPGSGKTTLAKILAKEFNAESLFVKCATDGTVDVLRTQITEFCNALSFDGKIKLVILDELDSSSSAGQNNFQMALRTLIEAAQDDTRFICTANFQQKLIPAVLSRCPIIPLKFDKKDLLIHVKGILDKESIKYNKESLKAFIEEAFSFYPDCRRIINYLQFCSSSGELVVKLNKVAENDKLELISDIVDKTLTSSSLLDVRKHYLANKDKINDYVEAGSQLFSYVVDNSVVIDPDGIIKLSDQLYQLNLVIDKETGFFGMIAAVKKFGVKR